MVPVSPQESHSSLLCEVSSFPCLINQAEPLRTTVKEEEEEEEELPYIVVEAASLVDKMYRAAKPELAWRIAR